MKAIRGATTIKSDTAEEVRAAVGELLEQICEKNNVSKDEIICILFSTTGDIHSLYPAKAARECGFSECALYSTLEPDIEGALKLCIRVMILVETDSSVPVYLNSAASLRKDLTKKLNIAVDGPAGSGKSTVCKLIARRLNILYLDTGAMYRAIALKCLNAGVVPVDEKGVKALVDISDISVKYENGAQVTLLDGNDVSGLIRTPQVSMAASSFSALVCVREKLVEEQRKIANSMSCVLDGRDIGTNVLPDAEHKFYLTASAEVRAHRRYAENLQKGINQSFDSVLSEIEERDRQDKERKIAPLKIAEDATVVDTSDMTIDGVVEYILNKIQEKV